MEYVSGHKLRDIFLDNGNWWKFFLKHRQFIRPNIIINVFKMLACRTRILGSHKYECPKCKHTLKVYNTCKSRFCTRCGKKATDNWIKTSYNTLPNTIWQHVSFTMPDKFWDLFWYNRYLFNEIPRRTANILLKLAKRQGLIPGIFLTIHTFSRKLTRNVHFHLSITLRGLSLDKKSWLNKNAYFHWQSLANMWRYDLITFLRNEFKKGNLTMPPHLKHIKSYSSFYSWTVQFYNKTWVVNLQKSSRNLKHNVEYLGRYIKRPPISETKILDYDRSTVTFVFLDHYSQTNQLLTLPVLDFIARLIDHIPNKHFRLIRYYGFLANRVRSDLLPIVFNALNKPLHLLKSKVFIPWREMIKASFGLDPLLCLNCGTLLISRGREPPLRASLSSLHQGVSIGAI